MFYQGVIGAFTILFIFSKGRMPKSFAWTSFALAATLCAGGPAHADSSDPDLIFRKSTTFKLLTPDDKLAVYGVDDPLVTGVACHYTAPEKGGLMVAGPASITAHFWSQASTAMRC